MIWYKAFASHGVRTAVLPIVSCFVKHKINFDLYQHKIEKQYFIHFNLNFTNPEDYINKTYSANYWLRNNLGYLFLNLYFKNITFYWMCGLIVTLWCSEVLIISALVEQLRQTTPVREGPGLIPIVVEIFFPYVQWKSWLLHPWHIWPWIACEGWTVERKTSIQTKNIEYPKK